MSEGYKVQVYIDGCLRKVRLHSPVDRYTFERLLKFSITPSGGVYVIHHPPADHTGKDFYREVKEKNPGMRAYVGYTTFETDTVPESWVDPCNQMDEIWVPSHFNVETFSRAGVKRDKLYVIPHGFDPWHYQPSATEPLEIGEKKRFNFLSIFEWTYRKGWDVLIKAYLEEFAADEDVRLIIRSYQGGGVIGKDVKPITDQLVGLIVSLGFDPDNIPRIDFIDKMVPVELMPNLYKMADAFVLPTRGEGWGIPFTESMLMEVPVIATRWSGHLEFMNDDNSYLIDVDRIVPVAEEQIRDNPLYKGHRWAEPSVEHTKKLMRYVFENRNEAKEKSRIAREHILNNFTIHHATVKIVNRLMVLDKTIKKRGNLSKKISAPKVLFLARANIFSLPGGDTEVMLGLKEALDDEGITVDVSTHHNPTLVNYDIVHIFNFEPLYAINTALQQKPYIVTPMYEDFKRYYIKSMEIVSLFRDYLESGDEEKFQMDLSLLRSEEKNTPKASADLNFIASNADAILVSGESEGYRIKRDFPDAKNIEVVRLGFNRPERYEDISPDLFISEYGVKNFVLCVGRLETRKNQMILLYALKDNDIPIVFVNGKTIQPEYEEMCKRFKRKGKTIFTGRISKEMLFSAYKAAKVHAIPSWYELPGLVSLEAAWFGCNVVTSDWGTIRDYLGNHAYYCEPNNPESIRKAVLAAMISPPDPLLREIVEEYTWKKEAERVYRIYERVLLDYKTSKGRQRLANRVESAIQETRFYQLREKAFELSTKNPKEAVELANHLLDFKPNDPTSYFIKGSAYLLMNYPEAEFNLRKVLELQPYFDIKAYLYLSLVLSKRKKYKEAIELLQQSMKIHPFLPDKTNDLIQEYITQACKMNNGIREVVV